MGYKSIFSGKLKFTRQLKFAEKELLKIEIKKLGLDDCLKLRQDNKMVTVSLDCKLDADLLAKDIEKLIKSFVLPNSLILNGLIHVQGEGFHDLESVKVVRNKVITQIGRVVYYTTRKAIVEEMNQAN